MSQQKLKFSQCKDGPDGPDDSCQPSSQATNCDVVWAPWFSQNSQETPENSQTDSQNNVENPTRRFPTEINLIDTADLRMNLDDFNQSENVLNLPQDIPSESSSEEEK